MGQHHSYTVSVSAQMDAPPQQVYDIIADYRRGHPSIVPRQFRNMAVEQGGFGDGTIITFEVTVFGRTQKFRAVVTEPEPGRVLVERNVEPTPSVTTFTVERDSATGQTRVTITSELTTAYTGVLGALEKIVSTRVMKPMYAEELGNLSARAREASAAGVRG